MEKINLEVCLNCDRNPFKGQKDMTTEENLKMWCSIFPCSKCKKR